MNIRDSEVIEHQLQEEGYSAAQSQDEADLVFINTCSVRQKAEDKMYSGLGRLKKWKQEGKILAVGGCVAQQERDQIIKRAPHVDLVLGTHQVRALGDHLHKIDADRSSIVATEWKNRDPKNRLGFADHVVRTQPSVFVTIQEGCDNVCTFCIVPFTRGREASRPAEAIVSEVKEQARAGAKEVILLGQNVNSYGFKFPEFPSFAELLDQVAAVEGIERIRFTSPHPKDYGKDLVERYARLDKLCPSAHLPLQAGSTRILEAMRRGYSHEQFLEIVDSLKAARPGMSFSSDVIVGFPGETRADFEKTLEVIEAVRFNQVYSFVYSPRPHTPAENLEDTVPTETKKEWLYELQDLQLKIQAEDNQTKVGQNVEVLWTDCQDQTLRGRTLQNQIVHATGDDRWVGEIASIQIDRVTANALYGQIKTIEPQINEQAVYAS